MRAFKPKTWETDKVLWSNRQWAVTEYGIENIAGPYHYFIEKCRLGEDWVDHMVEKTWVDGDAFREVFGRATKIHGEAA